LHLIKLTLTAGELLDTLPPGVDEVVAISKVVGFLRAPEYARFTRIVFDTAPTGHTLRLLTLPDFLDATIGKVRLYIWLCCEWTYPWCRVYVCCFCECIEGGATTSGPWRHHLQLAGHVDTRTLPDSVKCSGHAHTQRRRATACKPSANGHAFLATGGAIAAMLTGAAGGIKDFFVP